jgi:hypothetical protein
MVFLQTQPRAGALDTSGREALLRCVLRPPIAQDKLAQSEDGLQPLFFASIFGPDREGHGMDPTPDRTERRRRF